MDKIHGGIPPMIFLIAALFASCTGSPVRRQPVTLPPPPESEAVETPIEYSIIDYKNKSIGEALPEWVSLWLNSGVREVEALSSYQDRFVFVHRNETNNFNALNLWKDEFSPEFDFPRLAAARIEARFAVPYPDREYGDFYEALIRAASDAKWTGAVIEDSFWIQKKYSTNDDEDEREIWEFLVLVTMGKNSFTSQLDSVFQTVNPVPPPNDLQLAAANRVKENFFEGF